MAGRGRPKKLGYIKYSKGTFYFNGISYKNIYDLIMAVIKSNVKKDNITYDGFNSDDEFPYSSEELKNSQEIADIRGSALKIKSLCNDEGKFKFDDAYEFFKKLYSEYRKNNGGDGDKRIRKTGLVRKGDVANRFRDLKYGGGVHPLPDRIDFSFVLPNGKIESLNGIYDDLMNPIRHGKISSVTGKNNIASVVPEGPSEASFAKNIGDHTTTEHFFTAADNALVGELTFGGALGTFDSKKFLESRNDAIPSLYGLLTEGNLLDMAENCINSSIEAVFSKCDIPVRESFVRKILNIVGDNMNNVRGVDGYRTVCEVFFRSLVPSGAIDRLNDLTKNRPTGRIGKYEPGQRALVHKEYSKKVATELFFKMATRASMFDGKEKLKDGFRNLVYHNMGRNGHNSYTERTMWDIVELIQKAGEETLKEAPANPPADQVARPL